MASNRLHTVLQVNGSKAVTAAAYFPDDFEDILGDLCVPVINRSEINRSMNFIQSNERSDLDYIFLVTSIVTFIFGTLGNSLVIYIIARFSEVREKSVANYYIFNLALADEIYIFTLPLSTYVTLEHDWIFGWAVCKIVYIFREINKFGSVFTLVALSLDRYIASFHNFGHFRTMRVGKGICVSIWALSLAMCMPYFMYSTTKDHSNYTSCMLNWPRENTMVHRRAWSYSQLTIGLIVPVLLIIISYVLLMRRLKAIMKPRKSDRIRKPNRRMTRTIAVVVVIFLFCNLPYYIIDILNLKKMETGLKCSKMHKMYKPSNLELSFFKYFNALATILVSISSCCNPVLYGVLNENYSEYCFYLSTISSYFYLVRSLSNMTTWLSDIYIGSRLR